MRLWLLGGLTASLMALAGCATVDKPTVQARLLGKSITLISTRGTTPLNDEFGEAFVPAWGYREQLEAAAVAQLQASGRFSSVQRATLTATRRDEALKELKELKTPTEHVLLISGAASGDSIWASREGFAGLGVAQRSILRLGTESAAHVSLRADLLVPSTFGAVLGEATVATAQRVPAPALLRGPRLNDSVAAAARESIRVQIDAAVRSLVTQLGLHEAPAGRAGPAAGATPAAAPSSAPPAARPAVAPAEVPAPAPPPASALPVTTPNVEGRGIPGPVGR